MSKIILAHPGKQHSYRLASALKKAGLLECYVTTIYNKNSFFDRCLKKLLSKDNKKRSEARKNKDLDDNDVIQCCKLRGIMEALLYRIDKTHKVYRLFQRRTADRFGKKVAKLAIKRKVDAVIMYDSNATKCFEILKKEAPEIIRIMDASIAARPYMREIYDKEIEKSGKFDLYYENTYLWNQKHLNRCLNEIRLTQHFLVASKFVKNSIIWCGINEQAVHIVPYGANVIGLNKSKNNIDKLSVLFVGQVNYRKGIPYLLKAIDGIDQEKVDLTVVGSYNDSDWFIKPYINRENIHFTGLVTFDRMQEIYELAEVFVVDSFAEGMAQVGIEAMACGLPIICSTNSGVNDIVVDGESGFIIEPGDSEILRDKIVWFINNKDKIPSMGEKAKLTGEKFTWDYYSENMINTLCNEVLK